MGIYLAAHPHSGGVFQYNLSVVRALETMQPRYRIIAYLADKTWSGLLPETFGQVYLDKNLLAKLLERLYRLFDRFDGHFRRTAMLFDPMVKAINRSDCDLVIFPSQDILSYCVRKKSLASILDLMHRYEGQFEEYRNGEFELREQHFRDVCRHASGILVDSEVGKLQVMESYGVNGKNVFVLPFVPPEYLLQGKEVDVRRKYELPEKYLFYPAQFWEHKNHRNLLRAMKLLLDRGVPVNLVLVGAPKNHYREVLLEIDQLGLADHVFVLGFVSNDDMYSLYKNAVALTFVSRIGPTNIPPREAMMVGCPVIVSNIYAMPEQVGDAALLVDPVDPQDIADKIEMVWNDGALRDDLIEKGFMRISAYGQQEFTQRLSDIVMSLDADGVSPGNDEASAA